MLAGLERADDQEINTGTATLVDALRNWAHSNPDDNERSSWERQVRRLRALGSRFATEAKQLVEFANAHAGWGAIDLNTITGLGSPDTMFLATGASAADALTAGAIGGTVDGAVLLTADAVMAADTQAYVDANPVARRRHSATAANRPEPEARDPPRGCLARQAEPCWRHIRPASPPPAAAPPGAPTS